MREIRAATTKRKQERRAELERALGEKQEAENRAGRVAAGLPPESRPGEIVGWMGGLPITNAGTPDEATRAINREWIRQRS